MPSTKAPAKKASAAKKPETYVALLRGVNLGKRRLAMKDVRAAVEEWGAEDVATYVQSGNIVFRSPKAAKTVGRELEEVLSSAAGFEVQLVLRTRKQLAAVVKACPFDASSIEPTQLVVSFLAGKGSPGGLDALDPASYEPEAYAVKGTELYLHLPNGQARAKLPLTKLDKLLGVMGTARNWRTVVTLLEMADERAP